MPLGSTITTKKALEIVVKYKPLALKIAYEIVKKYKLASHEEDLLQEANLSIFLAAKGYHYLIPNKQIFSSIMKTIISRRLKRYTFSNWRQVRRPEALCYQHYKIIPPDVPIYEEFSADTLWEVND